MTSTEESDMRTPSVRDEQGIALVLAIVALVVIGALVAGTFFVSTTEQRTSVNALAASKAFEAAEAGLQTTMAGWSSGYNSAAYPGQVATTSGTITSSGANHADTILRLNSNLFLIKAAGTQGTATQSLAALIRLVSANPDVQAAVTARGTVNIGGNATVTGIETTPPNWTCSSSSDLAGIRTNAGVTTTGHSYQLNGNPATLQNDASVTTATFMTPFNQLKAIRTLSLPAGNYNGMVPSTTGLPAACDKTDNNNWGEPWRSPTGGTVTACTNYAPIIYLSGNSSMQNGRGQGVLLVEGDLDLRGNVEWTGIIITTGQISTRGTGSKVTGAVMANDVDLGDQTSFLGNPTVAFSRCAIDYVLQQVAQPQRLAARSWMQMY